MDQSNRVLVMPVEEGRVTDGVIDCAQVEDDEVVEESGVSCLKQLIGGFYQVLFQCYGVCFSSKAGVIAAVLKDVKTFPVVGGGRRKAGFNKLYRKGVLHTVAVMLERDQTTHIQWIEGS